MGNTITDTVALRHSGFEQTMEVADIPMSPTEGFTVQKRSPTVRVFVSVTVCGLPQ
jgi:hypothetical protein